MNKTRSRGRPREATGARDAILDVARRRFLDEGYDRVTLRSVAAEAGVDVALISYHFGSKKGLFGACLALVANPADVLAEVLAGPLQTLPERLVRMVVTVWDDPERGAPLRVLATGVLTDPDATRLFREMAEREMLARIAERLGGEDATRKAALAAGQIAGLIFGRYLLRFEPLASMPVDELVTRAAPALRAVLVGPRGRPRG